MGICLEAGTCIFAALLLLTLPLPWLLSAILAASIHEFCHILALLLTKTKIYGLRIGPFGAKIETEPMSRTAELLCAAAGPAGSLCLLVLIRIFPRLALCGAVQGLFNLLPLHPMDGGRILRCGLDLLLRKTPCKEANLGVQ